MKKILFISIIIAILASIFASVLPDGLDFVAAKLGFAAKAVARPSLLNGPLSGIIGVLLIFALFCWAANALKRWTRMLLFLLALILAASSPVLAARPLLTDDFYTVTKDVYELELGYYSTQVTANTLDNYFDLSFKRGILPNLDFGIQVPYTTNDQKGLNDIYLHLKYCFWKACADEGLTGRIDFKLKNGDVNTGLGSGDNDCWLMFIYSKMINKTKLHLNFAYVNVGVNAGLASDDYFAYAAAFEQLLLSDKVELVAEVFANNAASPNPMLIQFGGRYLIRPGLKIDAAYTFGLNSNTLQSNLTAGFHWEF